MIFKHLWLCESMRMIEDNHGYLLDKNANIYASNIKSNNQNKIVQRALFISKTDKSFLDSINQVILSLKIIFLIILVFAFISGFSTTNLLLSDNTINIYYYLISILGFNFVVLFFWFMNLFWNKKNNFFKDKLLLLIQKFFLKTPKQIQALFALLNITEHQRTLFFCLSFISHMFWFIFLISALVSLFIKLSTIEYHFIWQSSLITIEQLKYFASNMLFNLFQVDFSNKQDSSIFLLMVIFLYGILPRLILSLLCFLISLYNLKKFQLDLNTSSYRRLINIFNSNIIDNDTDLPILKSNLSANKEGLSRFVFSLNLEDDIEDSINIDLRDKRQMILRQLVLEKAEQITIYTSTKSSIDRGTIKIILDFKNLTKIFNLILLETYSTDPNRLNDWFYNLTKNNIAYKLPK